MNMEVFRRLKNILLCRKSIELGEFRTVYFWHRVPASDPNVGIEDANQHFANNIVVTSKYTTWNFFPKNLLEQFRRVANFYFLVVVLVQFAILDKTPVSPLTSLLPLVFVVTVTAIKQGYEDWKRHQADNEVNNRPAVIVKDGVLLDVCSKDIKVGDVVKVFANDEFPCDMVVVCSSGEDGQCHITTANLDGETNLKVRSCLPATANLESVQELGQLEGRVECDHPEYDMYKYNGRMILVRSGQESMYALGPHNLLLRGARLKNTEYVFGLAVYTGKETKMALNQQDKKTKFSTVERSMNTYLILFLGVLLLEAAICTGLKYYWQGKAYGDPWYLPAHSTEAVEGFFDFLAFLILFNYIIPISLYVTVELQKFCGSLFFDWDLEIYHEPTDEPAKANTSDLNEELGQVEYVFSDKTGTLTENDMIFRQCSIGAKKYMEESGRLVDSLKSEANDGCTNHTGEIKEFFRALALCHTVQADALAPEELNGSEYRYKYQASSPDEKALVEAAYKMGIVFQSKTSEFMEIESDSETERYRILHVLEFDSTRKRMSIILQAPSGEVIMFCKGAESHILDRVSSGPKQETQDHIDYFAELGLRTLAIACRKLTTEDFKDIDNKLTAAQQAIGDREEQLANVFDEVERNLTLLGATAIEDRLQDGVRPTIESLREAGIKVWVLTGDKLETAVNISHSCGHFQCSMEIMYLVHKKSQEEVNEALQQYQDRMNGDFASSQCAIVVDGATLAIVMATCGAEFVKLCQTCVAVLCCRMSPLQKAQIVKLVKHSETRPITLAIGDGANDCSMIQEAHVGCGIMGKEGRQAVRTSDYAFHRFRFLKRVLLVHGRYYYVRLSTIVLYFFYKNIAFITPQFLFQFACGFSAMPIYSGVFLTCYNIFFTSLPILLYGVFEQDLRGSTLMDCPSLYREISKNERLSWRRFFHWLIAGIWHSVVFYLGGQYLFNQGSFNKELHGYGVFAFGTFVFTICVIVTNLKLAVITHYWTWMTHFVMWGSIILYFVFIVVLCGFLWPWPGLRSAFNLPFDLDLYYIIFMMFDSAIFWFGIIALILVSLLPDVMGIVLSRYWKPTRTQIAQEEEKDIPSFGRNRITNGYDESVSNKTETLSIHSGKLGGFEKDDVRLITFSQTRATDVGS